MPETTTASRLLTLLSLLQGRRDWPGAELADRLGVSPRTVRRDVERLRELGYPVESLTGPAGGYTLRAGTAMPPLLLDDDEAIAIAVGLRQATRASVTGIEETAVRALVKLEQILPAHLRRRVQALQAATASLPVRSSGPSVDPQCLTTLAASTRDTERVRFLYRGRDGERTRRDVEPIALVTLGRRWYLVAWDPARDAWRTFRVDRIDQPAATGVRFKPRKIPGGDPAKYVAGNLAKITYKYEARVTFHAPAAKIRRRAWFDADQLAPDGDERCTYVTSDDDLQWLAMRILSVGCDFDVAGSPELLEHLDQLGHRLVRAAGQASGLR